eukprot:scaffold747_cov308-Prasinococcus_capsulatus_cf.AAC.4
MSPCRKHATISLAILAAHRLSVQALARFESLWRLEQVRGVVDRDHCTYVQVFEASVRVFCMLPVA